MDFNGVFTGKLHSDHRTPLCGLSDDFLNSKFWHQIWKLFVTSQCSSRLPPKNVESLKQQSCQVSCHLENSSRLCDLCGRKNNYFWPSWTSALKNLFNVWLSVRCKILYYAFAKHFRITLLGGILIAKTVKDRIKLWIF